MKNSIKNENENRNNLLENLFTVVANIYDPHKPPITHSESCYSFFFVWPCLIALVDSINSIRTDSLYFYPGEEKLRCMLSQLKKIDPFIDSRHGYNADAILRCHHYDDLECLILEVSSSYGRIDKIKHAQDHIKGTFGLLAMLKGIADRFEHGTIDTFKKIKVFFLQSYNECFYLWSLSYVGNDLYSLFRECKAKVPFDFHRKDETTLDFIILHHHLECLLMDLFDTLEKLKKEHTTNLRNRRYQSSDSYSTLKDTIQPTIVKVSCLKNNYKGIGDEEPTSSPVPF